MADLAMARFDYCRYVDDHRFKKCRRLHRQNIYLKTLKFYQPILIRELTKIKGELEQREKGFFKVLLASLASTSESEMIDHLIAQIRNEGFEGWLRLERHETRQRIEFITKDATDLVAQSLQKTFNTPIDDSPVIGSLEIN